MTTYEALPSCRSSPNISAFLAQKSCLPNKTRNRSSTISNGVLNNEEIVRQVKEEEKKSKFERTPIPYLRREGRTKSGPLHGVIKLIKIPTRSSLPEPVVKKNAATLDGYQLAEIRLMTSKLIDLMICRLNKEKPEGLFRTSANTQKVDEFLKKFSLQYKNMQFANTEDNYGSSG